MQDPYLALIKEQGGSWQASFPDLPDLHVGAESEDALRGKLPEALRDHLHEMAANDFQPPSPSAPEPSAPAVFMWVCPALDAFQEKPSEKLLDFSKAEFDRVLANAKVAEERARQNGVVALATIPILSFLKTSNIQDLDRLLFAACFILILVVVYLTALAVQNQKVQGMGWSVAELETEIEAVYKGCKTYRDLLRLRRSRCTPELKAPRS
ncbi:type II toxin-antitoxin system HicB family antitoxin [Deinococcus aestuarii]|uniref:type II toxin-antitoxin system HicB family antitoxin n=1 Tax=Deinococcus aestuarii TaxID=2774531 RepID=UPI001C0C682F|nr:hypothetical protein [Deinococcus aestuarii]